MDAGKEEGIEFAFSVWTPGRRKEMNFRILWLDAGKEEGDEFAYSRWTRGRRKVMNSGNIGGI